MRCFILLVLLAQVALAEPRIAWYASWKEGLQAAQQSQRPILLVAAADQCHGVSGVF